jgi:hypothetical protein
LKLPFNVIFRSTPGLLNRFFSLGFLTELHWYKCLNET